MATGDPSEGTVLVVDDTSENRELLAEILMEEGFRVLTAPSGEEALAQLEGERPDAILLDVMMPGLDGFETCRRIKQDDALSDIPIIFQTALGRPEDKIRAFEAGAVDYLTKPIHIDEALARIRAHVSSRRLQAELVRRNEELAAFSGMIAHDLRSPLSAVMGFSGLLLEQATAPAQRKGLQQIVDASRHMKRAIDDLMMLANIASREVTRSPLDMGLIVQRVLGELREPIIDRDATIESPARWPEVWGYEPWVEQLWRSLLTNGLMYGGEPPVLEIGAEVVDDDTVRFWVEDEGFGVGEDVREKIFLPFVRLQTKQPGHGLGLSIAQRITRRLGGAVGVVDGKVGSRFWFTLPRS